MCAFIKQGVCLLMLGMLLWLNPVGAASYPEVTFILDASGSMWGDAGGVSKIEAAKDVMAKAVPGLAPEVRVGLVAYGHRRKGDCADIEVLAESGSDDRTALLEKVKSLQPKGKTPITAAVSSVVEQLKTRENETTIVLVSDGIETCAPDPCQAVKDLKATGIKFIMHVVGFGVSGQATEQLACLAEAAGGKYLPAKDTASLLDALNSIQQAVSVQVEAAKSTPVTASTGLGKLVLTQPEGAGKSMAGLRIIRSKDGKEVKKTEGLGAESKHPLPADEYELEYLFAAPNYGEPTVTKLGKVQVQVGQEREISLGSIAFNLPQTLSDEIPVDKVLIRDAGSQAVVVMVNSNNNGYYNFLPKALLPGKYDVLFHYANSPEPSLVKANIIVEPGKESLLALDSGIVFKEVADSDVTGWDLVPLASAAKADKEEDEGSTTPSAAALLMARPPSGNKSTLWTPYVVPPGKYRLVVQVAGMGEPLVVAEELEIRAGETLQFNSGL